MLAKFSFAILAILGLVAEDHERMADVASVGICEGTIDQGKSYRQSRSNGSNCSSEMKVSKNIPYAKHPGHSQRLTSLDIYAPRKGKNRPIMVYIHGGGWRRGDKKNVSGKAKHFVGAGYLFVSINYRLIPKVKHPQNIQDVADAVAWVHDHAKKYGGNADQIFVMGHSAGAHLAALVATDERRLRKAGKDLSVIKGAIPLDVGAYDLMKLMPLSVEKNIKPYLRAFGTDPVLWRDASPVHQVVAGRKISPFLIVHVSNSKLNKRQSELLAAALKRARVPAQVFIAENRNHGSLNARLGGEADPSTKAIMKFLEGIRRGLAK